jgi:hypothetical protein
MTKVFDNIIIYGKIQGNIIFMIENYYNSPNLDIKINKKYKQNKFSLFHLFCLR